SVRHRQSRTIVEAGWRHACDGLAARGRGYRGFGRNSQESQRDARHACGGPATSRGGTQSASPKTTTGRAATGGGESPGVSRRALRAANEKTTLGAAACGACCLGEEAQPVGRDNRPRGSGARSAAAAEGCRGGRIALRGR